MRFPQLLRHGVTAGAAAGLCAAVVLLLLVEPVIDRAIAVEEGRAGHGGGDHEHVVSRTAQLVGGWLTAVVVGVLVGVVFAVVWARARHRLWGGSDLGRSIVLAALAFGVVTLLPALATPANPPGVGDPDTVTRRTLLYALTVLLGILVVGIVAGVDRRLAARGRPVPWRACAGTALAVACSVAVLLAVPDVDVAVPDDVPAALLWEFRVASLAQLATLWLVLGLAFGTLVDPRTRARRDAPARSVDADAVA